MRGFEFWAFGFRVFFFCFRGFRVLGVLGLSEGFWVLGFLV